MSSLSPAKLEEMRRTFEAARSFEDDDDYITEDVHGNTPTPGAAKPVKRPPPTGPRKSSPAKAPKPSPLKKSTTEPAAVSRVARPSLLRQELREPAETITRQRRSTAQSDATASEVSSTHASHPSHGSNESQASYALARPAEANARGIPVTRYITYQYPHALPAQGYWAYLDVAHPHIPAAQHAYYLDPDFDEDEQARDGIMHGHWDRRYV